jgi:hypothetical protein
MPGVQGVEGPDGQAGRSPVGRDDPLAAALPAVGVGGVASQVGAHLKGVGLGL